MSLYIVRDNTFHVLRDNKYCADVQQWKEPFILFVTRDLHIVRDNVFFVSLEIVRENIFYIVRDNNIVRDNIPFVYIPFILFVTMYFS